MAFFIPGSIEDLHAASKDYSQTYSVRRLNEAELDIPSSAIFAGLGTDNLNGNRQDDTLLPSIAHCAAHLELVEAFKIFRECVIQSNQLDVLFDTMPQKRYTTSSRYYRGLHVSREILLKPVKKHDATFPERRKGKWVGFFNFAFLRFAAWAIAIEYNPITNNGTELSKKFVPPLDVLMVWHAFLLKPELCLDWFKSKRIDWINRVNFPWKHIHTMIDASDRMFHLPASNAKAFKILTQLEPDLLISLIADRRDALPMGEWTTGRQSTVSASAQTFDGFDSIRQIQIVWVDRMCHFLWIRSPALEFTLKNARSRYQRFLDLLPSSPNAKLAPPPDVELVRLTHQLSPLTFAVLSDRDAGFKAKQDRDPARPDQYNIALTHCFCWDCQNLQRLAEESSDEEDSEKLLERSMQEVAHHRAVENVRREKTALRIKKMVRVSKNGLE